MGINDESETSASLQIGPTTLGMVRLYIETETLELPLDFDPDEAEEIADELRAAAARAREARAITAGSRQGAAAGTGSEAPAGKARAASGKGAGGRPPQGGAKRRRGSGSSR